MLKPKTIYEIGFSRFSIAHCCPPYSCLAPGRRTLAHPTPPQLTPRPNMSTCCRRSASSLALLLVTAIMLAYQSKGRSNRLHPPLHTHWQCFGPRATSSAWPPHAFAPSHSAPSITHTQSLPSTRFRRLRARPATGFGDQRSTRSSFHCCGTRRPGRSCTWRLSCTTGGGGPRVTRCRGWR